MARTAVADRPETVEQNGTPTALAVVQPDLITLAIEKGMDADSITKLVALVENRERQAAERAFTEDKRACEQEMPVILKSKKGGKANYAPLDEINYVVKPIYTKHGFSLSFGEGDSPLGGWKRTYCDIRHSGGHSARYHLDLPLDGASSGGGMNTIQGAISTGSYAQRVLICRIFNLTIALTDLDGSSTNALATPDEVAELKSLLSQLSSLGKAADPEAFLAWLGRPSFDQVTVGDYEKGVRDIRGKISKAKNGGAK